VSASVVVKVGSGANPSDRPGLAGFHAGMLDKGTTTREALEIADEVSQLGASFTTGANADATQVQGSSLRRVFPSLLAIMADVVLHPSFLPEEIERERAARIGTLVQQRANAGAAAQKSLLRALYGSEHPYGYLDIGTETALRSITRDDLRAFWSENFGPGNAALIVSGQITVDELRPMVEQAFGTWSGTASPASSAPARESPSIRLVLIDRPGAEQTQVRVGTIGIPRAAEDYAAMLLMNQTLGGLNSSRIRRNLRGEHGYTYFVSSQFGFRRSAGPFSVSSAIRSDATAPAIAEIIREIRRIRDESVTDEELLLAKDFEIQSVAARYETSALATAATTDAFVYDLGLDYYTNVQSQLTQVTTEQVQAAALQHLDPSRLVVVAAGDLARIRGPLEELGLGPVELRDADGEVIR
jgi:zinc protease